jgi:hypothetical protein
VSLAQRGEVVNERPFLLGRPQPQGAQSVCDRRSIPQGDLVNRPLALLVTLVTLAALPALAIGAKPPATATIGAQPGTVIFSKSTAISGKITGSKTADVEVALQENPAPFADGTFNTVATTRTAANGSYTFTRTPALATQYRVVAKTAPTTTSAVTTVNVRLRVSFGLGDRTPEAGQRVRFFGSVWPQHDGRVARIQRRRADGTWATVARTTLLDVSGTERSGYSRLLRVNRDGVYRIRVTPSDGDHLTGTSRARLIDTH